MLSDYIYTNAGIAVLIFMMQSYILQDVFANVIQPTTLPITSICAGFEYACAAFENNKIKCWGAEGAWGQVYGGYYDNIGDVLNELAENLTYVKISDGTSLIEKVTCGGFHLCVKYDSGKLKCVGSNFAGQTGSGYRSNLIGEYSGHINDNVIAANFGTELKVLDVAVGQGHTCVKLTGNKVKCIGYNKYGQLGLGDQTPRGLWPSDMGDNLTYVDLGTDVEVASVHSGFLSNNNCVILSKPTNVAQRIKCWGDNDQYQYTFINKRIIGDNVYEMGDNLTLIDFGMESRVKQLAVGSYHTCALLINNELKCFGAGYYGNLGLGSTLPVPSPGDAIPTVPIDFGKTIKFLEVGEVQTCIVYNDSTTAKCVGKNYFGLLGQGDDIHRGDVPESTFPNISAIDFGTGNTKIVSIQTGRYFNCILLENSLVKCWGNGRQGQLANGMSSAIGDEPYEMGTNLSYAQLFETITTPTNSPTLGKTPTKAPTLVTAKPTTASPTNITKNEAKTNSKISSFITFLMAAIVISVIP